MSKKFCKLIMVAVNDLKDPKKAAQSNKYYIMEWDGTSSDFGVKYGRVESTEATDSYPIGKWDSKYNEKIKKGYRDVTHTVAETVLEDKKEDKTELAKIEEAKVDRFLNLMKKYTDNLVHSTYTVKFQNVTQSQVDNAQEFITDLTKIDKKDTTAINSKLLELYMEIPRRMVDVRNHLLPNIDLEKTLQQEQDNLDAMVSQLKMYKTDPKADKKVKKEAKTLMDILGIQMKECKCTPEIKYLIDQIGSRKIEGIFEVQKAKEDEVFEKWLKGQKDTKTRILIHGTKCTSVIPILEQGLKIRPTGNYQFSGKVYGNGNYYSETVNKSLNYTGYDPDKILLVYEVHTGNPFIYDGWFKGNSFSLTYPELQKRGFDSTFVKAGGGLLNSEIIAYKEEQCRIKYIIHIKS